MDLVSLHFILRETILFCQCIATSNEVFFHLIKVDKGYFAIAAVGKSHILAGVGNANPGLFRSRLHTLSQYFGKVFEQLK